MAGTDADDVIEYLEEDAEIVQQCVQSQESHLQPTTSNRAPVLLVERSSTVIEKKKRKKEEDSDYDPAEETVFRRKQPPQKKARTFQIQTFQSSQPRDPHDSAKENYLNRKKYNIRIPDYDDPLCLPVRAIRVHESDKKRLNNWNNVCLEHFKYCDEILKPERGDTKKSVRTAIFKNVVNKLTGGVETTIWSKTCVENVDGDKKSEIFQCVLPRYKEKKVLGNYILGNKKMRQTVESSEAILSKENHKDGEALVVYKPKESMSAVYGLIDKRQKAEGTETSQTAEESKMYLRELACCKLCTSCFQGSWRGVTKQSKNKTLVCPICARTYVSIYNLLSHFKTHDSSELRRYRKIISCILADVVGYHYKCRICTQKFDSIKGLRQHTPKHQSKEVFQCEVGNHLVNLRK